jgi:uncharacterized protein (TIGR02421 family)
VSVQKRRGIPELAGYAELDGRLRAICDAVRILPAATAENAAEERVRLTEVLARGETPVPEWRTRRRPVATSMRAIDEARDLARPLVAAPLYLGRLDELELDLALACALGDPRLVRPIAARRYGTGAKLLPTARRILEADQEPRLALVVDTEPGSLSAALRSLAASVGIPITIRLEPRLAAIAASGDRTVFLSGRAVSHRDAVRLAVHEVLGHLVAAANARAQPIAILDVGTAGSFADQEGLAVFLEEAAGLLDTPRMRTLAARVVATHAMHSGASFGETACTMHRDHGFSPEDAIAIAERAHRGGGLARDVGYLDGWLAVRDAVRYGDTSVDELRTGRVSLDALPVLRELASFGLVRPPRYCPPVDLGASLAFNLRATPGGTILETSPPSAAASFTRVDAT